jgi:hypothetical protein
MAAVGSHTGRKGADDQLAALLAFGHTVDYAAKQAHVSPRTAYRRLQNPSFRRRIEELRSQAFERTASLLISASTTAVTTLVQLLNSSSDAVKLGAARSVIEHARILRETANLEDRLAALEARLETETERERRAGWR